ncbi:MAG TPA: DUF167 domain-containing protein [Thermodesulfobacteriota bacterium]|nr:DUF167 domain-containing protein [Thermodesulfobacteriota bacterium]
MTDDPITIDVLVKPRSSRGGIDGVEEGRLKVRISAPPVDGKANEQLTEIISSALGVPKSSIEIIRGRTSRRKTLRVAGLTREFYDNFLEKLAK